MDWAISKYMMTFQCLYMQHIRSTYCLLNNVNAIGEEDGMMAHGIMTTVGYIYHQDQLQPKETENNNVVP